MPSATGSTPPPSASNTRLLVALLIFGGCLSGGVFLAFSLPPQEVARAPHQLAKVVVPGEHEDADFFYDAIGRTPRALTAPPAAGREAGKSSFTLEIKVATSRDSAEQLIDDLHARGVEAYYTPLTRSGRIVYRVRQGMFGAQKDAEKAALALRKTYDVEAKVVKLQ